MLKSNANRSLISEYLAMLELYTKKSRGKCLEKLKIIFDEDDGSVTASDVEKTLEVFVKCIKEDMSFFPLTLSALLSLLTNVKIIQSIPVDHLLPSALALILKLKTLCIASKTNYLRELSFQVFLSYPVPVINSVVTGHCAEIVEIFKNFRSEKDKLSNKELCVFLQKLLLKLQPVEKNLFLKEGVAIWFGEVIPGIMTSIEKNAMERNILVDCLEILANGLVDIDYSQCPQWVNQTLPSITNTNMFPKIIMNQLREASSSWHRLWIVFVKILKNQITRNIATQGTPINAMLPVVELAFKMDVPNRCRAFQCWDSLIDNFSKEIKLNGNCLPKTIKLLLVPLKLNNAKSDETALAKLHTWWNLLRNFQSILDRFTNEILIAFMHFAFGKPASESKPAVLGAGQIYDSVNIPCLQAFVEILGHTDCNCSKDLPKLNGKIMNNKLLASYWSDWMYALKAAIHITFRIYKKNSGTMGNDSIPVLCAWRAFVITISELPPNGVRRDMFNGLIEVLIEVFQESKEHFVPDILFSLTLSLSEDNENVKSVILSTKGEEQPMHKILTVITKPQMNGFYERWDSDKRIEMLKPLTDLTVESMNVDWLLDNLTPSETSLKIWTALVYSVKELHIDKVDLKMLDKLLLWPLRAMNEMCVDKSAATAWCALYNNINVNKAYEVGLARNALQYITAHDEKSNIKYLKLCVTICLLKTKLINQGDDEELATILEKLTSQMVDYNEYVSVVPLLVDTIVIMLHNAITTKNQTQAKLAVNCFKNLLAIAVAELNQSNCEAGNTFDGNIIIMLNNVFQAVESLFKIEAFTTTISEFVDILREHSVHLNKESALFKYIIEKMESLLLNCSIDIVGNKIHNSIELLKGNQNKITGKSKEFTSPDVKKVIKRSKKKEASIINTIVENGEEYVVVKSNWKFNPKKLTENQKEKLQRKREDIPALYQDLSQSQDEFRLSSWKTDSQDTTTTTTSSNSKSNNKPTTEDASNILKSMPNSDVVPNIMENILAKCDKNHTGESKSSDVDKTLCTMEIVKDRTEHLSVNTIKNSKSPRMALKDRVFQNVRNLIEKSSPKNVIQGKMGELHIEFSSKTPVTKMRNNADASNSAPPSMTTDRPSRVKRKPKKFDDVQLFTLKRRRNSLGDSLLDPQKLQNENDVMATGEIEEDNVCNVKNIDQANTSIDSNNINQPVIEQNALPEINIDEPIQDLLQSERIPMETAAQEKNNEVVKETISINQNSDEVQDFKMSVSVEIKENYCVSDLLDLDVTAVTQTPGIKNELDKSNVQKNSDINNTDVSVVAQDDSKIEEINDQIKVNTNNGLEKNITFDLEKELKTPAKKVKEITPKATPKKTATRKSRIEKELAIDMVEGHPFLKVQQSEKRMRKKIIELTSTSKRKSSSEKQDKAKAYTNSTKKDKKLKEKGKSSNSNSITAAESEDKNQESSINEDFPCSEDVIESSQDSTFTTISVKSSKKTPMKTPIVAVEKMVEPRMKEIGTQDLLQETDSEMSTTNNTLNCESKDDSELPQNKTAEMDKNHSELTENMDTASLLESEIDVVIMMKEKESPITVSTDIIGPETQELAEADTLPNDPADFVELESTQTSKNLEDSTNPINGTEQVTINENDDCIIIDNQDNVAVTTTPGETTTNNTEKDENPEVSTNLTNGTEQVAITEDDNCIITGNQKNVAVTTEPSETTTNNTEKDTEMCSPFKDDAKRKQDFLNNTSEISPIKTQSPDKDKSTSLEVADETSSDYLVVKLSSPVHSNGEPFDKCGSPEFFTDDKVSPDKRDQSPPRVEVSASSGSPSSSLSLKRSRPQAMRPAGRAAQMLGLCVPDSLNTIKSLERNEPEEPKKGNTSTPARRNLRVLYNAVTDSGDSTGGNEDNDNFLKFEKALPSTDSSPSVPILKRKLIDIVDDTIISPATKRKRVSFHDPPVSTTVSVQKYIEPNCIKSPSSAHKRLERQMRSYTKSPKRLENAFVKLDTMLSKAVESFIEDQEEQADSLTITNDTTSLDETPAVEVVNTSELNDTDPICPDLVNCTDPIENIATELSSPAMKDLLIKELEGKVTTLGDLAKMTELEVNRLCIKAPKVQIAKKVLADYLNKRNITIDAVPEVVNDTTLAMEMGEEITETEKKMVCVESQTNAVVLCDAIMQTRTEIVKLASTQTDPLGVADKTVQTLESGSKTTSEVILSCLSERKDFVDKLSEHLDESTLIDMLTKKSDKINYKSIIYKIMDQQIKSLPMDVQNSTELSIFKDILCERFDSNNLVLLCGQLLQQRIYKPA